MHQDAPAQSNSRTSFRPLGTLGLVLALFLGASESLAQLRIVSYNTAEDARSELTTIFTAIGEEQRNGIAKPIDVLALQEQTTLTSTTDDIVDLLNGIYGAGTYARGTRLAATSGAGRVAVVYNTNTVDLLSEGAASSLSGTGAARQTLRYQFRPVGYDESADFYLYNSHYKASTGASNESRRNVEAGQIRANADFLGEGASLIFAGDLNLYSSSEAAYQTLLAPGAGQAIDPLNTSNSFQPWNNNSSFATFHTQSPCSSSVGNCGVGGGVDSRFDFQLVSGEVLDDEGFSLIDGSYHPFGNNGTTYNQSINSGSNTVTFPGVTSFTKSQILNALRTATDHLPLVADYQLPAVLNAFTETIPDTVELAEFFTLDFSIFNDADVVAANGADELDYSFSTTGDVVGFGATSGTDAALGGVNLHQVVFDTTTLGMKTGEITITSASQSAANSEIVIPISFEVVAAALAGDYNDDGVVDAADYSVWRDELAAGGSLVNETASPGVVDSADYDAWVANFGAASAVSTAVPEPSALAMLCLTGLAAFGARRNV